MSDLHAGSVPDLNRHRLSDLKRQKGVLGGGTGFAVKLIVVPVSK
jgi:hypothetical protein